VRAYLQDHGIRSNAGLEVPVVAVGKLGNPDVCERALADGDCDLVMLARPLLADPDWPRKVYAGRVDEAWVGDERATPQPGGFYGGWVTSKIVGPIKGEPGSFGW